MGQVHEGRDLGHPDGRVVPRTQDHELAGGDGGGSSRHSDHQQHDDDAAEAGSGHSPLKGPLFGGEALFLLDGLPGLAEESHQLHGAKRSAVASDGGIAAEFALLDLVDENDGGHGTKDQVVLLEEPITTGGVVFVDDGGFGNVVADVVIGVVRRLRLRLVGAAGLLVGGDCSHSWDSDLQHRCPTAPLPSAA